MGKKRLILILLLISFGVFGMLEEKQEKDNFRSKKNTNNNNHNKNNHHNKNNIHYHTTIQNYVINIMNENNNNKNNNNNINNNKNYNNINNNKNYNDIDNNANHNNNNNKNHNQINKKYKRHIDCNNNNNNILRGITSLTVPTTPSESSICYSDKKTCCSKEAEQQLQRQLTTTINDTIKNLIQPIYNAVEETYELWKAYVSSLLSSMGETTEKMIQNEFQIKSMHLSISQLIQQFNSSIQQSIHPSFHPYSTELSQSITKFADQLFLDAYFQLIHPATNPPLWGEDLKKCIVKFRLPNHQFLGTLAFKPSLSQLSLLSRSFHSSLTTLNLSIHPSQCQRDLMKMAGCPACAQQHTCINYCLHVTSNCFRPLLSLQPVWNNFVDAFIKYHQFVGEAPTMPFRLFPLRVFDALVEFMLNSRIIYNTVHRECANHSYPDVKPANLTHLEEKARKLKDQKKSFFDNSLLSLLEDDYNSNIADEDYRNNKVLNDYYHYNLDNDNDGNQDDEEEEEEDGEYGNYDYDDEGYVDGDDVYATDDDGEIGNDDSNYDDGNYSNSHDVNKKHKKRRKRYADNNNNNKNNNNNNINNNINMFMKSITNWIWLDVPPSICRLFIPDNDPSNNNNNKNNNNNNKENSFLIRGKRATHHRHFSPHDKGDNDIKMNDKPRNNIMNMQQIPLLKHTSFKSFPPSSSSSFFSSFSSSSYLDYYTEFDLNHYRPFFKDSPSCVDQSLFHSQGLDKSTEPSKELLDVASDLHNLTHRMVFKFMSPYRPELESGYESGEDEDDYDGEYDQEEDEEYEDEEYNFEGSGEYIYDFEVYDYGNETEPEEETTKTTTHGGHHHILPDIQITTTSTTTKSSSSFSSSSVYISFFCIIFVIRMF